MTEKRSIKNIFVKPKEQIRFIMLLFAVASTGYLCFIVVYFKSLMTGFAEIAIAYRLPDEVSSLLGQSLAHSALVLSGVGCCVVVLMMAVSLLLSHRIYGPIIGLEKMVKRLRERDYGARVTLRERDEFKTLAKELNLLAEDLQARAVDSRGFSLIEMLIVCAIMTISALAMLSLFDSQIKMNNGLEIRGKKEAIRQAIVGQFLNSPVNCACLFAGSSDIADSPALPGATLSMTPTSIGVYQFVTPGDCSSATMPQPFANAAGVDGVIVTAVGLTNILRDSAGKYSGHFKVSVKSQKSALGGSDLSPIDIPVSIDLVPSSPGLATFRSCSMQDIGSESSLVVKKCNWVVGGAPVCTPPACPTGYTDLGWISHEITAMHSPYEMRNEVRVCNKGTGHTVELRSVWTSGSPGSPPAACPAGFTDHGTYDEVTASGGGGHDGGHHVRICTN